MTWKSTALSWMLQRILKVLHLTLWVKYSPHSWKTSSFLKGGQATWLYTATCLNNVVNQSTLTPQQWRRCYLHWAPKPFSKVHVIGPYLSSTVGKFHHIDVKYIYLWVAYDRSSFTADATWKVARHFFTMLNAELPDDPSILLPGTQEKWKYIPHKNL